MTLEEIKIDELKRRLEEIDINYLRIIKINKRLLIEPDSLYLLNLIKICYININKAKYHIEKLYKSIYAFQ